jgi:hypothetical protein
MTSNSQPYFGLVKCEVLPPRGLFHPVLPYRSRGKLLFPLCRVCATSLQQTDCDHDAEQRQLLGTWTTLELDKALSLGYQIVRIFEIYQYDDCAQYDGVDDDTGLFTGYINAFLKMKQEASGWPSWVHTDDDKEEYIRRYREREGIDLDRGKIEHNGALRCLAKLCLNSLVGLML